MTLDLAAIDRELDALGSALDLGAWRARAVAGVNTQLDAVDAELAALESGVHLAAPQKPSRPAKPGPAVKRQPAVEPVPAPPEHTVVERAPAPSELAIVELAPAPEEHASLELALVAEQPSVGDASLSGDALFGADVPFQEPPTRELGGLEFEDLGQGVTVSPELAALLEGELDPDDFGPRRPRQGSQPTLEGAEGFDVSLEENELEVLIDDGEFSEVAAGTEPLPSTDTSPSIRPEAPAADSQRPAAASTESRPPEGGEKKGFFKKIFGK